MVDLGGEDESVTRARARVGTTICNGKYRIERLLGIGGMASVYAAAHRNGHRVAIKMLHPELSIRADIRSRFRREAHAANGVNHPGAVDVIDDDIAEDGSAFLVMELLAGQSVEALWEQNGRQLPPATVLSLALDLCDVLAAAHDAGIVHRDLKPENLFVTNDGLLKVLDFGLARVRDIAKPKETTTGMVFGTPAFMPPEQANGETSNVDAQSDLWAVGATMFTLLSGATVHDGKTAQHFVILAATKPARSLATVLEGAEPRLVSLVDRALAVDKSARWTSARAMATAIRQTNAALYGEVAELIAIHDLTRIDHSFEPPISTTPKKPSRKDESLTPILQRPAVNGGSDTPVEIDELTTPDAKVADAVVTQTLTQPLLPKLAEPVEEDETTTRRQQGGANEAPAVQKDLIATPATASDRWHSMLRALGDEKPNDNNHPNQGEPPPDDTFENLTNVLRKEAKPEVVEPVAKSAEREIEDQRRRQEQRKQFPPQQPQRNITPSVSRNEPDDDGLPTRIWQLLSLRRGSLLAVAAGTFVVTIAIAFTVGLLATRPTTSTAPIEAEPSVTSTAPSAVVPVGDTDAESALAAPINSAQPASVPSASASRTPQIPRSSDTTPSILSKRGGTDPSTPQATDSILDASVLNRR